MIPFVMSPQSWNMAEIARPVWAIPDSGFVIQPHNFTVLLVIHTGRISSKEPSTSNIWAFGGV